MTGIVEDQIRHSLGDANYDRVIETLGVMRDELVGYEEPKLFNDFVRQIKEKLLKEELGGDRRELWWLVRRHKLGLIDKKMSDRSEVSEEEAKEVSLLKGKGELSMSADSISVHVRKVTGIASWCTRLLDTTVWIPR